MSWLSAYIQISTPKNIISIVATLTATMLIICLAIFEGLVLCKSVD